MSDHLSDRELEELKKFDQNRAMKSAVKKVILGVVYQGTILKGEEPQPNKNFALLLAAKARTMDISNEKLGEDLNSIWQGINLLEGGFNQIVELTKDKKEEPKPKKNEAR